MLFLLGCDPGRGGRGVALRINTYLFLLGLRSFSFKYGPGPSLTKINIVKISPHPPYFAKKKKVCNQVEGVWCGLKIDTLDTSNFWVLVHFCSNTDTEVLFFLRSYPNKNLLYLIIPPLYFSRGLGSDSIHNFFCFGEPCEEGSIALKMNT